MRKDQRREKFENDWKAFYANALAWFDGYLYPNLDGIKPVKFDRKRLKKLFKLLQKGY